MIDSITVLRPAVLHKHRHFSYFHPFVSKIVNMRLSKSNLLQNGPHHTENNAYNKKPVISPQSTLCRKDMQNNRPTDCHVSMARHLTAVTRGKCPYLI